MGHPVALGFIVVSVLASGLPPTPAPDVPTTLVSLDSGAILTAARGGHVTLALPLEAFVLDVVPNPMAEGAVWGLDGVPRGIITETVTFEGTANGFPAYLAATGVGVFALIFAADPILVEPAWLTRPGAALNEHRVASWSQDAPVIVDEEPELPDVEPAFSINGDGGAGKTARFLLESDFSFYRQFSLLGACQACALQVQQVILGFANALWNQSDVGVEFQVTSQWLCTTAASCPYQDSGSPIEMSLWLSAFRTRWENTVGEPAHDVGHLMIGTNLPQWTGLALGLAGTASGYSLSEAVAVMPSSGTGADFYAIAAHEIGHNFNGVHGEADPIPPALAPTGAFGVVVTIMWQNWPVQWQFSDGSWNPAHNNRGRIVASALSNLPT